MSLTLRETCDKYFNHGEFIASHTCGCNRTCESCVKFDDLLDVATREYSKTLPIPMCDTYPNQPCEFIWIGFRCSTCGANPLVRECRHCSDMAKEPTLGTCWRDIDGKECGGQVLLEKVDFDPYETPVDSDNNVVQGDR
jgi:hypothetical protein